MKKQFILSAALALVLAGCGSKAPEKLNITGYYEMTGMVNGGEPMDQATFDQVKELGLPLCMDVYEDGTAELNVLGEITELTYDVDAMKFYIDKEELDFTYEEGVLTLVQDDNSLTFELAEKPEATPTPAAGWPEDTGSAKRVGMADIGFFNLPDSWVDESETDDPNAITLHYWSSEGTYSLMAYSYRKDEWEQYGSQFGEVSTWIDQTAGATASDYADILVTSIYDIPVFIAGYEGSRADLTFNDDSALTNIIFKDDAETIHILTFETFTADACAHMDDLINYVVDSFSVTQ